MSRNVVPRDLRALIFDLDGTLYDSEPMKRAMLLRLASHVVSQPRNGMRTLRALREYRAAHERLRGEACTDLAMRQLEMASDAAGVSREEMAGIVRRWMHEAPLPLLRKYIRPGLVSLLESARRHGLLLAVLSDYPAEEKLSAMEIRSCFDLVICAQDPAIQRLKPHPRGLQVVLERLGVNESQAMYIGDRPEVDGQVAENAGVTGWIVDQRGSTFASIETALSLLVTTPGMATAQMQNIGAAT